MPGARGQNLDLGTLIGQVQVPPVRKLGVFDVDAFFPPKDGTELALRLNSLIASPSFAAWGEGQELDPESLLRTPEGKPRCAIVYLAHLSDQERQFVVTLVLSKLVTWMRGQPGTSDLRTLAYMDEVFGFVPPTAMPPAKKPILTILKQGRAFGVGMALATQNPVDLDYKAMSNAGTWLVGRLQTERDKARVLEGLRSAAGSTDVAALDTAIGALQKRQFLLVSAKSSAPVLFQTRWAMSYLRGPLTKEQIETLMREVPRPQAADVSPSAAAAAGQAPTVDSAEDATTVAPAVAPASWSPTSTPRPAGRPGGRGRRGYAPERIRCRPRQPSLRRLERRHRREPGVRGALRPVDGGLDLDSETIVDYEDRDFGPSPPPGASYVLTRAPLEKASFYTDAEREIERAS